MIEIMQVSAAQRSGNCGIYCLISSCSSGKVAKQMFPVYYAASEIGTLQSTTSFQEKVLSPQ